MGERHAPSAVTPSSHRRPMFSCNRCLVLCLCLCLCPCPCPCPCPCVCLSCVCIFVTLIMYMCFCIPTHTHTHHTHIHTHTTFSNTLTPPGPFTHYTRHTGSFTDCTRNTHGFDSSSTVISRRRPAVAGTHAHASMHSLLKLILKNNKV